MKIKLKSKFLSILLVLVMVLALLPVSALSAFAAGGTEFVHFAIEEHWGVYFEQTGSNNLYPITLTNENKLSAPLPTLTERITMATFLTVGILTAPTRR